MTATEVNGKLILKDEMGKIVAQLDFLGLLQIAVPPPPPPPPLPDVDTRAHNSSHDSAHA